MFFLFFCEKKAKLQSSSISEAIGMIAKMFAGWPLFWISATGALILYQGIGVPLWAAVIMNTAKSLIVMVGTFWLVGKAETWMKRWPKIESRVIRWRRWRDSMDYNNLLYRKRLVVRMLSWLPRWLLKRRKGVVIACAFLPLPFLPAAVIPAVAVMKIRHGFLLLVVASIFRSGVFCWAFYSLPFFG